MTGLVEGGLGAGFFLLYKKELLTFDVPKLLCFFMTRFSLPQYFSPFSYCYWLKLCNKRFQFFLFVIVFLFAFESTAISQVPDSSKKVTHNFGLSIAIGPRALLIDTNQLLGGPNFIINTLWYHNILLSMDLHAALTSRAGEDPTFVAYSVFDISLMPGYRFYINRYSAFQFQGGISYGEYIYRGEKYKYSSGGANLVWYDDEKINYIGLPVKVSYELFLTRTGAEFYVAANFHHHYEAALGINFLFGILR